MKLTKLFGVICFCGYNLVFSQQINIDNTIPLKTLVEQHLSSGCIEFSNVSSSVNGSAEGFNSYGAFTRANSTFPLTNGIVISTGNAASGGNTENAAHLNQGSPNWKTDPDFETALDISNTVNATSIEFDFISYSDTVEFNYVLASEEYFANYPCYSSDGFVFLIKENNGTDTYKNVALVPETNTPVTVGNVHDKILNQCEASNGRFFEGYYLGNTNFNGQTKVLKAATNIKQNTSYHAKLIVADYGLTPDPNYDTAVFITAGTTTNLNLGENINTCASSVTLNGQVKNPLATYLWYKDGALLTGENSPTLQISQSGTYRVSVNLNNACTLEDEILVVLENEQTVSNISDYQLCDTDGDNQETFNLSTKNAEVINAIKNPPKNYAVKYYAFENDARNNTNNITNPITSGPTTIFVRVDNLNTGCVIYGNFNLVVNPKPNIVQPTPLNACDNDDTPDGITFIDLSEKNTEITAGQNNLTVSYHYSQLEADSNLNPLSNYKNTFATETLYIRVENTDTGCFNTSATLTVNVTNGNTEINRSVRYVNGCDTDHDGFSYFNLITIANDIIANQTPYLPPTFHTTLSDAQTDSHPIANPNHYQNTVEFTQTIFVRFEYKTTGCYTVVPIELHTNLGLSATNLHLDGVAFCDYDGDGTITVNLADLKETIKNEHPNLTITFFETTADRTNNIPLNELAPYTVIGEKTLYLNIEGGCREIADIVIKANPIINFTQTAPFAFCDTNSDGITTITLSEMDQTITNGNTNYSVSYFLTETDANTNTNPLPPLYYTNSKPLFARISSKTSDCYSVSPINLEIIPAPAVTKPTDIVICDNDLDGFSIVNLTDKIPEIVLNPNNVNFTFYKNRSSAANQINAITNTVAYNAKTETIWVRVQSTASSCYSLVSFKTVVNTNPDIPTISSYQMCVAQDETKAYFVMATKDAEILNGDKNKEILYFEDSAFTKSIDKNTPYLSTGNQTVYVKKVNKTDVNCFNTASFTITIAPKPIYNTNFTNFAAECQNGVTTHTFDFGSKRQEMALGSPDSLDIKFYITMDDAEANANTALPDYYTTKVLQGQFYVRIENTANSCSVIDEVRFTTFPNPVITSASIAPVCDTDYDGTAIFDLTQTNKQIESMRFNEVSISYYEDEGLTRQIPNSELTNYTVYNNKTIYLKAENVSTKCYTYVPLELKVNTPPQLNTIGTHQICDNETNTFQLKNIDKLIVNNTSAVNITYYATQTNALNANNAISEYFNYTSAQHTIYVRVEDKATGCPAFTSFTLQINPNPIIVKPTDIIACDDDFDGFLTVDLPSKNNEILGGLNHSTFTITYYGNQNNADTASNALDNVFSASNNTTVYARVENRVTGCFSTTQFNITINPLPTIPLNDNYTLCVNDLPLIVDAFTGNPNDTYLWSNGSTSPELILDNPDAFGNYWVTVTTPHTCTFTKNIVVKQSGIANIDFTTKVDFADPNSITVNVSGISNYEFILDDGDPQTHNTFSHVALGLHTITIRDLNGCNDATTQVFIIDAPKFFTPNNDGYFDTWHIVGIDQLPGTTISIHDRYGKLLKTLDYASVGWDGTYNGSYMPSDDYWFVANVIKDGKTFKIENHFALKR